MTESTIRLDDPRIDILLARLDELVRWRPGAKGDYKDLHSAIARLKGSTNHIILGRRGSGKTRLLDELRKSVTNSETIVITVGAEDFKELTYPDILIQILRSFLKKFEQVLSEGPSLFCQAWWEHWASYILHPVLSQQIEVQRKLIANRVSALMQKLECLLAESDEVEAEYAKSVQRDARIKRELSAETKSVMGDASASAESEEGEKDSMDRKLKQREVKRIKVERLLTDFKELLSGVCAHLNRRIILAVDDLYFIRRPDQPLVVDYIHRICKDTNAFVKIATIKHRSELFTHAEVSRGVVLGHEIQAINLELPLGQYEDIDRFLKSIWQAVCSEVEIQDSASIFVGDGCEQAILASGGVPRDFLGIAKAAIIIARERSERGVGKRRVNEAARQYAESTKLPELCVDVGENDEIVNLLLCDIVYYVRDIKRKNCFHIDIDRLKEMPDLQNLIDALVDSRLLHLITDNTSNARRAGRFAAYLLDVGLYGHPERRSGKAIDEVRFWVRDDAGRLKNLDRSPVYTLRPVSELKQMMAGMANSRAISLRKALLPDDENASSQLELFLTPREQEGAMTSASDLNE